MKVIIDADSIIFAASCSKENIEDAKQYTVDKINSILDVLSDNIEINDVVICNGSVNNFRKDISSSYKLNRTKDRPKILGSLHDKIKEVYGSYWGDGVETDDVVATLWKKEVSENGIDSCVIVSQDKDYKQFDCWFFDSYYKRMTLSKITKKESLYNFYEQMIVGDSADNVNYCKGYGKAFVKKYFNGVENRFGFIRKVYYLYTAIYGIEARTKFKECYQLLKLRTNVSDFVRRGKE